MRALRTDPAQGQGSGSGTEAAGTVDRPAAGVLVEPVANNLEHLGLPAPLPPPPVPGAPSPLIDQLTDDGPIETEALRRLAADAAARALELASGLGDGGLDLSEDEDLARLAAGMLGEADFDAFATKVGDEPGSLRRLALAWRAAGRGGLAILDASRCQAPTAELKRAKAAMTMLGPGATAGLDRVTNSGMGIQLRWGADGLWYLLRRRGTSWELHDPPSRDPRPLVQRHVGQPRLPSVPTVQTSAAERRAQRRG